MPSHLTVRLIATKRETTGKVKTSAHETAYVIINVADPPFEANPPHSAIRLHSFRLVCQQSCPFRLFKVRKNIQIIQQTAILIDLLGDTLPLALQTLQL